MLYQKKIFIMLLRIFKNIIIIKKLKCYIYHLDKEYDNYDVIKSFRDYYEQENVDNFIKEYSKDKKIKSNDISNNIKNFNKYFNEQKLKINLKDFKKYFYKKKLQKFIEENDYDDLIIQFDELDHNDKDELSKKIKFNEKYNREIYLELCQLITYQIDKVTKSVEILNENDIESALNNIKKNMNDNFEKLSKNSKDQFLCFKKLEINVFKYQALKKHMGSYIQLPKSLQRQGLINIKNDDNYCFIWSYIRYLNPCK